MKRIETVETQFLKNKYLSLVKLQSFLSNYRIFLDGSICRLRKIYEISCKMKFHLSEKLKKKHKYCLIGSGPPPVAVVGDQAITSLRQYQLPTSVTIVSLICVFTSRRKSTCLQSEALEFCRYFCTEMQQKSMSRNYTTGQSEALKTDLRSIGTS